MEQGADNGTSRKIREACTPIPTAAHNLPQTTATGFRPWCNKRRGLLRKPRLQIFFT